MDWFKSHLTSRKQFVRVEGGLSLKRPLLRRVSHPGVGDSAYERGGDPRRKVLITPLKETNLDVAQAFFDP